MTPDRVAHKGIDLRFVEASEALRARGIHGWVYGTHAGRSLDGLRVLRADDGRYVCRFSSEGRECTGPGGVEKDRVDHDLILDELRGRGLLP